MKYVTIIVFLAFLSEAILAQQQLEPMSESDSAVNFPRFEVHLGAGVSNGLRVGVMAQFHELISTEISYGNNLNSYFGGATLREIYTIGLDWHGLVGYGITFSPSWSYIFLPGDAFVRSHVFAFNLGYLSLEAKGLHFFARGGFFVESKQDYTGKFTKLGPSIDLGVGWRFY